TLENGTSWRRQYSSMRTLPLLARLALRKLGGRWTPEWITPLLRRLVTRPGSANSSSTVTDRSAARVFARAQPTTPAPTMTTEVRSSRAKFRASPANLQAREGFTPARFHARSGNFDLCSAWTSGQMAGPQGHSDRTATSAEEASWQPKPRPHSKLPR